MSGVFDRAASFHVGQLVRITDPDLNLADHPVHVKAIETGNRVTVDYGGVANLTLSASKLAPVAEGGAA